MPRVQVDVTRDFSQPVEDVFAALSDHDRLSVVMGVPVKRIREGDDMPNGVGSVRRMGPPVVGLQETVTAIAENDFIEYRISSFSGPVRNHEGRVEFSTNDGGTRVRWTIGFDAPPLLATAIQKTLSLGIELGLDRLAKRL